MPSACVMFYNRGVPMQRFLTFRNLHFSFALRRLAAVVLCAALLLPTPLPLQPQPAAAHDGIDIVSIVRDVRDSVVSVSGTQVRTPRNYRRAPPSPFEGFPFDFFPFPFSPFPDQRGTPPRQQQQQPPRPRQADSFGSGFTIANDGDEAYILTNAHVVANTTDLVITLADGTEYTAEVVGSDRLTDIAVLKVEPDEPLAVLPIGDSEALAVGQSVLAVGSPFGLDQTVTSGIISALARRLPGERYVPFIQTDAPINPGNSGGPLLNARGEAIGINAQIISPNRASAGIGFAIPINVAMDIQRSLRESGEIRRGYLGVYFQPVSNLDAQAFGLDEPMGALVREVTEGSAAEEAGVVEGDIILRVDGEEVDPENLPQAIGRNEPGDEIVLQIWRDGETIRIPVVLGDLSLFGGEGERQFFGLVVEDLDEETRQRAGVDGGVQVAGITGDRETAPEGIEQFRAGDVITHVIINQRTFSVGSLAVLDRITKGFDGGAIAFRVWRDGRRLIITIKV